MWRASTLRWSPRVLTALLLTVAPACGAKAGGGGLRAQGGGLGDRIVNRFAYRPAYPYPNPVPRTRPLYLSGFAGARYGPEARGGPVGPLSPTSTTVAPQPVPYWTPTAPGLRGLLGLEPGVLRP